MKCSNCGHDNRAGARFCGDCGASLAAAASSPVCPACGKTNRGGVKFCESCGATLAAAVTLPLPVQLVPPARAGMPGWAWALIGCGVALMALVVVLLWQVLPLRPAAPLATAPTVLVTIPAEQPTASSTAFCPQAGGVILFWNPGYVCANDLGDPGYRERYGDGSQDVNNLQFDNQASAVMIPQGWSVKLYEGSGRTGANVCFNTSVADFTAQGNFPDTSKPINNNVSSMETFADRQCGLELAAGAPPAPLPPHRKGVTQPGVPPVCDDATPCACLPEGLQNITGQEFNDKYVQDSYIEGDEIVVIYKDFDKIYDTILNNPYIYMCIHVNYNFSTGGSRNAFWCTNLGPWDYRQDYYRQDYIANQECVKSDLDAGTVRCTGHFSDTNWPDGIDPNPGSGDTVFYYTSGTTSLNCVAATGLFPLQAIPTPGGQCTASGYGVVCGTRCCRTSYDCCLVKGKYQCMPNRCHCKINSSTGCG